MPPEIAPFLRTALAAAFFAILALAAAYDLHTRRVPNALPAALLLLAPFWLLLARPAIAPLATLGATLALFAVLFLCWIRGWLGGGDVKLASTAALWCGAANVAPFLLLTAVAGGVLALLLLLARRWAWMFLAVPYLGPRLAAAALTESSGPAASVPYAVAIACGGIAVVGSRFAW